MKNSTQLLNIFALFIYSFIHPIVLGTYYILDPLLGVENAEIVGCCLFIKELRVKWQEKLNRGSVPQVRAVPEEGMGYGSLCGHSEP